MWWSVIVAAFGDGVAGPRGGSHLRRGFFGFLLLYFACIRSLFVVPAGAVAGVEACVAGTVATDCSDPGVSRKLLRLKS